MTDGPSLHREVLDRLILWLFEQNCELKDEWLDDDGLVVKSQLPLELQTFYDMAVERMLPLSDGLLGLIHRRVM